VGFWKRGLLVIVVTLNGSHHLKFLKFDPFWGHSCTLPDFLASLAKRHGTEKVRSFRGRNPKRWWSSYLYPWFYCL